MPLNNWMSPSRRDAQAKGVHNIRSQRQQRQRSGSERQQHQGSGSERQQWQGYGSQAHAPWLRSASSWKFRAWVVDDVSDLHSDIIYNIIHMHMYLWMDKLHSCVCSSKGCRPVKSHNIHAHCSCLIMAFREKPKENQKGSQSEIKSKPKTRPKRKQKAMKGKQRGLKRNTRGNQMETKGKPKRSKNTTKDADSHELGIP